ncbi:molybdopterin-guanine dinucleotide biosynthesis protein B [Salipaludibacillus keqinensis]|jgi:molybdopterin-guanine dinucleotide biosynthesis adapter protein|uniref:Molybdopterin-guanine dinucleotide biosynthesis protein B n=1 Tax=Salipaludibacillus keqinensis TaxID=2045207 RepID=A0A323TDP1_9BACI|nr:molybdopterin-guanine dinucleotide biosynthesis protein B [Salipaludibacillus keqinensis]PYZ93542.1 molybdopterin-guanine dinucleotide biosynthesis protein B [Salipaludibacillus keqinensis]
MKIHQIVGYTNSGKTTIISTIIRALSLEDLKVATIKHHGHEDPLVKESEEKDSVKHRNAGAVGTLVANENEFNWIVHHEGQFLLEDYVRMYQALPLDLLLIEGYKKEAYMKTVILRSEKDLELLHKAKNITAVICWDKDCMIRLKRSRTLPLFHVENLEEYVQWFKEQVIKGGEYE